MKVDIPAKYVCKLAGDAVRDAGIVCRGEQRRTDLA